jgi:chromosome segregation ATPase
MMRSEGKKMRHVMWSVLLVIAAVGFAAAQDISSVEQKAEALREQLRGVTNKQAELQSRLTQLEEDLKPENIQRSVAGTGTTDANALRDQRQQQLERQKASVEEQLRSLDASRTRLEASIASAEAEGVRQRAAALGASNAASTPANTASVPAVPSVQKKQSVPQVKKVRHRRASRRRAH